MTSILTALLEPHYWRCGVDAPSDEFGYGIITMRDLGGVDGFEQDEASGESDDGCEISLCLFAA